MNEDPATSTKSSVSVIAASQISKYEGLIDIPATERIIDALVNLFNYLDMYAPRTPVVYLVISIIRFFQLIGGAFMAANTTAFLPGTLTFNAMSIITVLFHIVPVQYRYNHEFYVLYVGSFILLFFTVYLIYTAHIYKRTGKVPKASTLILSIYMSVGPFLILPIVAQYFGQQLSGYITKDIKMSVINLPAMIISFILEIITFWILRAAYTSALVFRPCSFQAIEGSPQNTLLLTTTIVTLVSAMTTYFDVTASAVMIVISILFYIYSATTCFNCGTFIDSIHQVLVLGGSILGLALCAANLYIDFAPHPWGPYFFVGFLVVACIVFILTSIYLRFREKRELALLDALEETEDIMIIKRKNKFKQVLTTGFKYAHPVCVTFKIFRLATEQWKDCLDVWTCYAKFAAIYADSTPILTFIMNNITALASKSGLASILLNNASYIIKTRESSFTAGLKSEISKFTKTSRKAKNRLRNIWDLLLQGNTVESTAAIIKARESVEICERAMNHLMMQYPNNRFAARQQVLYYSDIVCNPELANEAAESMKILQRGGKAREDIVHTLGLAVFKNMPETCQDDQQKLSTIDSEMDMNLQDEAIIEEEQQANNESIDAIYNLIKRHKVPSIVFLKYSVLLSYFLLIFCPFVAMIIFYKYFTVESETPLTFMEGIAITRNIITMMTASMSRYLLETLTDPSNTSQKLTKPMNLIANFDMTAFGGYTDIDTIIRYLASQVAPSCEKMSTVVAYKTGNTYIDQVRNKLYTSDIDFKLYFNSSSYTEDAATYSDIAYMIANHAARLMDEDEITIKVASEMDSLTCRNNNLDATDRATESLKIMIEYLLETNSNYQKIFISIICVHIFLILIVFFFIYWLQVHLLNHDRHEIINVLITIPKTIISQISASLNQRKNENGQSTTESNDNDIDRQELGIIKMFSTISDGSTDASNDKSNLFAVFAIIILGSVCSFLSMYCFITASNNLLYNCHHINYLFGTVHYMNNAISSLLKIALAKYNVEFLPTIVSVDDEISNIEKMLPMAISYFQFIRLGGEDSREVPFAQLTRIIDQASDDLVCANISEPPLNLLQSVHCFVSDQQFDATIALMKRYYAHMTDNNSPRFPDPTEQDFTNLWQIGPIELYAAFFYPADEALIPMILEAVSEKGKMQKIAAAFGIVLPFLFTIFTLVKVNNEDDLFHFSLRLFLKCPAKVIASNQRIMDLLSGEYHSKFEDLSAKHIGYSNDVVNKLNDAVVVTNEETGEIAQINNSFEEMFSVTKEQILGTNIKDFFISDRFNCKDNIHNVFTKPTNLTFEKDGDTVFIEVISSLVSGKRIFSVRDMTQNYLHEILIQEERKKSDTMLASILPASLVPRVQAGEKNISFSVQSATVLFLDVVSFTPWCGSHDAQYVMRILNIMFKEFDAITNAHKTMTKIKCIGDCYMAAGGIFDEVNQPQVHAKEVVDFGCLVIKKLMEIDERENESLRIRVGINTGGPIVAGVIGTEKPTFEILGPTINIAHEMESHGVPMNVHVSRPVYELIYGSQFNIKERGEVEIKGGNKMFTYLVEP